MKEFQYEFDQYKKYTNFEQDCNKRILEVLKADRKSLLDKIKELKGVLRVPRLYRIYRTKIERIAKAIEIGSELDSDERETQVDNYRDLNNMTEGLFDDEDLQGVVSTTRSHGKKDTIRIRHKRRHSM